MILSARSMATGGRDNREIVNEQVTLLLDSGAIASFDLAGVRSMQLLDPHLHEQLKQYLTTIAQANSKAKRSIYVDSNGSANRNLRLSYITPVAIWKSSYRLSLDPANSRLEGWAIVDNTTDEDWNSVKLSVVSGRPISFISLLDTPRYGNRQVAELPEDKAAGPVVYSGAQGGVIGGVAGGAGFHDFSQMAKVPIVPQMAPSAGLLRQENLTSAMRATQGTGGSQSSVEGASGATLGELFEYNFTGPVTIKKNQSAMLPFLQDKIVARKLLIYKNGDGDHPVNAAEVTNNTGKTLDGGPITVYDDGAYAGEALVETFKSSDKRLIGYAVDYGTLVQQGDEFDANKIVREISANQGILTLRYAQRDTTTYAIKNVDPKAKTLIVQQEGTDYQVLSPKPLERTSTAYRFEVHLPANGSQELKVERERLIAQETAVNNSNADSLVEIVQNKQLSDTGRRQLQAIVDLKTKLIESQANLSALNSQNSELVEEQSRLRQNIDSLNRVKGQEDQVRQYSSRLGANETEMAKLRDQRDAEMQRKKAIETDLRNAISKLQF